MSKERDTEAKSRVLKKISKKIKKVLDKHNEKWYNKKVKREG